MLQLSRHTVGIGRVNHHAERLRQSGYRRVTKPTHKLRPRSLEWPVAERR